MPFTRTARTTAPTLATEAPLRSFDQIRIGTYLTGPGLRKLWLVVELLGPDSVGCMPLPLPVSCAPTRHTLTRQGLYGQVCGSCGYRIFGNLKPDVPQGNIITTGTASTYVMTLPSAPLPLERGTVYAHVPTAASGRHTADVVRVGVAAGGLVWAGGATLPVFPTLRPIWSVPDAWKTRV